MLDWRSMTTRVMFGDVSVMIFNMSKGLFSIMNEKYMPFQLKGKIQDVPEITNGMSAIDISKHQSIVLSNVYAITRWLSGRVLLLSRRNAKKIYDTLGVDQSDDNENKMDIAFICRAVSVLDKYWLKFNRESICWKDVNLRINKLNTVVAQVALYGESLTFEGSYDSPEFTTHGLYAKAWRRHSDGYLWLHKMSDDGKHESLIEVEVSNILDKCNVEHVKYVLSKSSDYEICMCRCIADESTSIVSAFEYREYCSQVGLDFVEEVMRIDYDSYCKMLIVDYLISNDDRHARNWGFCVDNDTMEVVSLHKLFDHNKSFSGSCMNNKNAINKCTKRSMYDTAVFAMSETDFHFIEEIRKEDFFYKEHYNSFMERASELGVKVIKENPFFKASSSMKGD